MTRRIGRRSPSLTRVLMVIPWSPYPARTGGQLRVAGVLEALQARRDVEVDVVVPVTGEQAGLSELMGHATVHAYPSPGRGRAAVGAHLRGILSRHPSTMVHLKPGLPGFVEEIWRRHSYDVLQVEFLALAYVGTRPLFAGRNFLTAHFPAAAAYAPGELKIKDPLVRIWSALDYLKLRRYETAMMKAYHTAFVVSEADRDHLERETGLSNLAVARNAVDLAFFKPVRNPSSGQLVVLSVCSFDTPTNVDGVLYFLREVWDEVARANPKAIYKIVGRSLPPRIRAEAHRHDRVEVVGEVEDVRPYFAEARVSVVTLRAGAGSKLRVLTSMAMGVPLVLTTKGADGLDIADLGGVTISDHAVGLANAITTALLGGSDKNARELREFVEQGHSWSLTAEQMVEQYQVALEG